MTAENDAQSLNAASQLTGLDAKWLQPFDVEDPFNENLRLKGFLSQKPDHRYGALAITHVGGVESASAHSRHSEIALSISHQKPITRGKRKRSL